MKSLSTILFNVFIVFIVVFGIIYDNTLAKNVVYFYVPANFTITIIAVLITYSEHFRKEIEGKEYPFKRRAGKTFPRLIDWTIILILVLYGWFGYATIQMLKTMFEYLLFDVRKVEFQNKIG